METVSFLFTDIEGSTRLWERFPAAVTHDLPRHDALLRSAVEAEGGRVFKTVGDAVCAAFPAVAPALAAALLAQRRIAAEPWAVPDGLRVRMAVHAGPAEGRGGDYFGPTLNRLARMLAAGHGGQVLVSAAARALAGDELPPESSLIDLGDHRLRDLERPERLFQLAAPGLASEFPPLAALGPRPTNLPARLDSLVGRERELAELGELLSQDDGRLVTLTGPGGIGKTSLALEAATRLLPTYESGAFLVALETIRDPARVAPAIAQALGLREVAGESPLDTLADYLRERRLLLVLDNFEQVLDAAPVVATLLTASRASRVLVTSRAALRLRGERELEVAPLALPPAGTGMSLEALAESPAVDLFVRRARAARPDFALDARRAADVAEICRRLDGLPLAIELAAARTKVLGPGQMLPRLASRLGLLTGGARDLPERQRTLRDAIAWSFDLLGKRERELFARLGVFSGGFTLEAAARVCGLDERDTLDALDELLNASLVRRRDAADGVRFTILETLREFANERLAERGEASLVARRHTAHFLALAEAAEPHLTGAEQIVWLERLEADHDNLRSALGRALEDEEPEIAARLVAALWRFWLVRAHPTEGRTWLERALAPGRRERLDPRLAARALNGLGVLVRNQGDYALAESLLEKALELARQEGDRREAALALTSLGVLAYYRGEYGHARALHEESLAIRRETDDRWGVSVSLGNLALLAQGQRDYARARALYEDGLALSRELGERFNAAVCVGNLGNVMLLLGDVDRARALYEEALGLRRELGDRAGLAAALHNLGLVAIRQGRVAEARAALEESLTRHHELGDKEGVAVSLEALATLATARGDAGRVGRLLGAADALRARLGAPLPPGDAVQRDAAAAAGRAADPAAFDAGWQAAKELGLEQAVAMGLEPERDLRPDPSPSVRSSPAPGEER